VAASQSTTRQPSKRSARWRSAAATGCTSPATAP
jgi:hypothetical protein